MVYRLERTYNEDIDLFDLKYIDATTTNYTLPLKKLLNE